VSQQKEAVQESQPERVDFSYAFATPHRLTVALPDSSDKTLLDLQPGHLRLAWTYDDLRRFPLAAFMTPKTDWEVKVEPQLDGHAFPRSTWRRLDDFLPALDNEYCDADRTVTLRLQVIGSVSAAVTRVDLANTSAAEHRVALKCCVPGGWAGLLPAWVDPAWPRDNLQAGWKERADRVLVLLLGGEEYEVQNMNTIFPVWRLKPGEKRTAWLIRPYRAYDADMPALRQKDWQAEFDSARDVWRKLLGRAARLTIPDAGVAHAHYACLGDLFIMREPVAEGYIAGEPGTECYRAPNAYEAGILAVALDQAGYHAEAAQGYQLCLDLQEPDGNWSEPKGWAHHMWGGSGFKCWTAMEHYRLTGDKEYLAKVFPRMAACSRWQEQQRARTRVLAGSAGVPPANNQRPLTYGLMPRGMGDAGLKDGNDLYGVFLPHNIWAVYADKLTVEAARILGHADEAAELERFYRAALEDLLQALDRGAIQEQDYRWIPAVPGKTCGSRWGALNAAFPCGHLPAGHELITGTIRKIESKLSPGGIPIHTGWLEKGMWVAITLDNLAEVHLQRDNGDAAVRYLYATLNHGTPLYTWCEERGPEPGAKECTGDRQHLWTPVAVVRAVRDSFVMEDDKVLHLARGTARSWLAGGGPVGVQDAPSHFGRVSFEMRFDAAAKHVTGTVALPVKCTAERAVLHVRLPAGLKLRSVASPAGLALTPDGAALSWPDPRGTAKFEALVEGQQ